MRPRTLLALAAVATVVACDSSALDPIATTDNVVDTVTLGALRSTAVSVPSGYSIASCGAVRTEFAIAPCSVDFVYDIDSVRGPALYPAEVLGLLPGSSTNPGFKRSLVPFDSLLRADLNGYTTDSLVPIDSGDVLMLRSQISCSQGVPLYGKLVVTGIDTAAHTVTFQILVDENCGFRGLVPGLPTS